DRRGGARTRAGRVHARRRRPRGRGAPRRAAGRARSLEHRRRLDPARVDPRTSPTPRVVIVSSGSVYGAVESTHLPIDEGEARQPLDLYAATKSAMEDVCRIVAGQRGVSLVVARVFNLLGPGLQDRHLAAELAAQVAGIKLGLHEAAVQVGPLDTTRDFV